jgi:hypothetical protein
MIPPRLRVLLVLVPLIGIGCLCLALADPGGGGKLPYLFIGQWFGTLFGHTSVAAAWAALGPAPWYVRVPLAGTWLAALIMAMAISDAWRGGTYGDTVIAHFAALLLGQWLLMQVPLWALAWTCRLELRHRNDIVPSDQLNGRAKLQFGIRQLMALILVVAIVLGIMRTVLLWALVYGDLFTYIFLAVAACVLSLPLIMAALLLRRAVAATIAVVVLIALATAWELSALHLFRNTPGTDAWHFVFINSFMVFWILTLISAIRLNGYGLVARHVRSATA